MHCPRCKNTLSSRVYETIHIDTCTHCGGIWLDAGELQPIVAARDVTFTPALIKQSLQAAHSSIPKAEMDAHLACPKCSAPMQALNYNYSSGVIVNSCAQGDGLWFDKEELESVQIFMEHWDDEEKKEKWMKLQEQTRAAETARLEDEERLENSKAGPIGRAIDKILDMLKVPDEL